MDLRENYDVLSTRTIAKRINDLTFTDYYYRLMLLARSMFTWKNLPNGIEEKHIEKWLYAWGRCIFFKDDMNGFMIAQCTDSGALNYYDEPTSLTPFGTNFFNSKPLENDKECVVIRNNYDCIPTKYTIQLYAMRLTELERTIDINVKAQKTPVMIYCSDRQKLSLKNMYTQWAGNEPVIYGDKNILSENPLEVLRTDAPIVFDKLQIQKKQIWNEVMTFLGVNNANMDKRERLVDDEVQANNEQVMMFAQIMLETRKEACKRINEMFGLNIEVELRTLSDDVLELLDKQVDDGMDEVMNDSKGYEEVSNGSKGGE